MSLSWKPGMSMSLPTIHLDPATTDRSILLQAYCLNPPLDSCEFGPCPNIDVTGIGQQISIYVTSVVFSIVLVYCPRLVHPLIYAHLGLIYSLLIATTLSVCFGILTKNDEIFVLVIVASPASVALWCMTIVRRFPLPLPKKTKPPSTILGQSIATSERAHALPPALRDNGARRKDWEWEPILLQGAALGSLVFELVMVFVTMAPQSWRVFRQPACAQAGPGGRPANALWAYCYLEGAVWAAMGYVLWELMYRGCHATTQVEENPERRRHSRKESKTLSTSKMEAAWDERECWRRRADPDIITWTEVVLDEHFPTTPSGSRMKDSIILLLQCIALPDVGLVSYQNVAVLSILVTGILWDLCQSRQIHKRSLILVLLGIAPCIVGTVMHFSCPTSADLILAYVCIVATWRGFSTLTIKRHQVFLRRFMFIFWVNVALAGSAFAWVLYLDAYSRESIIAARNTRKSFANLFALPLWFLAWLSTSVWPNKPKDPLPATSRAKRRLGLAPARFLKAVGVRLADSLKASCATVNYRAHILKAGLLIITPNIIWIQISIASDISDSPNWTFGQLFAMLVSFVSIISLVDAARNIKRDVWWTLFRSRAIYTKPCTSLSALGADALELPLNSTDTRRPPLTVQRNILIRA